MRYLVLICFLTCLGAAWMVFEQPARPAPQVIQPEPEEAGGPATVSPAPDRARVVQPAAAARGDRYRHRDRVVIHGTLEDFERVNNVIFRIDGQVVPLPISLRSGLHRVEITAGQRRLVREVEIRPGESTDARSGTLVWTATHCEGESSDRKSCPESLCWMARHQEWDGSFRAAMYQRQCDTEACRAAGAVRGVDDAQSTGLALLVFLGAGETHNSGAYKPHVKAALKWMKERQTANGWLVADRSDVHAHAIATLALTEAYGLTGSRLWKATAQRAVEALVDAGRGPVGWPARSTDRHTDAATTAWASFVLRSAKMAELNLPDDAWTDGVASVQAFGPPAARPFDECAALCAARAVLRETIEPSPEFSEGIARLMETEPGDAAGLDPRDVYFASVATFQVGLVAWKTWKKVLEAVLYRRGEQRDLSHTCAAWLQRSAPEVRRGRLATTSLTGLSAELFYRYGRVFGASSTRYPRR